VSVAAQQGGVDGLSMSVDGREFPELIRRQERTQCYASSILASLDSIDVFAAGHERKSLASPGRCAFSQWRHRVLDAVGDAKSGVSK
jgi:hypothetical protein